MSRITIILGQRWHAEMWYLERMAPIPTLVCDFECCECNCTLKLSEHFKFKLKIEFLKFEFEFCIFILLLIDFCKCVSLQSK